MTMTVIMMTVLTIAILAMMIMIIISATTMMVTVIIVKNTNVMMMIALMINMMMKMMMAMMTSHFKFLLPRRPRMEHECPGQCFRPTLLPAWPDIPLLLSHYGVEVTMTLLFLPSLFLFDPSSSNRHLCLAEGIFYM
jgi:hypothetical protein